MIIKNKTLHIFYDCIWLDLQIDYFRVQVFGRTEIENCAGKKRKLLNLILVVVHLLLNGDHGASRMCQNYHLWFTSLSSWLRPAQSFRTRQFRYVLEFHVLQIDQTDVNAWAIIYGFSARNGFLARNSFSPRHGYFAKKIL